MKTVKFRIRKKYRWLIIPLVLILLALVLIPQFLASEDTAEDSWVRIKNDGRLVALVNRNSMDYFLYRGEPRGYQLDMLESLAGYLGVSLKILCTDRLEGSLYLFDRRAGDILAWNLPVVPGSKDEIQFTNPLWETRLVLVQKGPKLIRSQKDFKEDTVWVEKNPFMQDFMKHFAKTTGHRVTLIEDPEKNEVELVKEVSSGKIKFAICRENLAQILINRYRNIDTRMVISPYIRFSWGLAVASDSLKIKINEWLDKRETKKEIRNIFINYYDNPKLPLCLNSEYCSVTSDRISPFDSEIKRYSKVVSWDWRLIASLIYEESNFHMDPVSARNARGLMQMVPETAEIYGMDSTSGAAQQILSGIKYLKWIDKQLPPEITNPRERICFILASYNVGIGRVLNAREKARKFGQDPNKWNGNVDYYMTRKSKKNPYGPEEDDDLSPNGEPGSYVDRVLSRYDHYRNLVDR